MIAPRIPRQWWRTASLWLLTAALLAAAAAHATGRGIYTGLAVACGVLVLTTFRRSIRRDR